MPPHDRSTFCWFEAGFPPPWFMRYERWIVSAACFSAVFLALGIECSYVILFVYLQEEFDSTATATGKVVVLYDYLRVLNLFWYNIKGSLDKYNITPIFFPKKLGLPFEVLAWALTACQVLRCRLTYFWRNMNISMIFYFSKSAS